MMASSKGSPSAKPSPSRHSSITKRSTKGAPSKSTSGFKNRVTKTLKAPPSQQQKTKPSTGPVKKKRKVYSEKELGVPRLNMITPVGVEKPKGKKKGKVFVDDAESMMTILALVNADKEGQIESKMMKSRQMEEIREARRVEAEKREERKKGELEGVKNGLRNKRKRNAAEKRTVAVNENEARLSKISKTKKSVSFG